MWKSGFKIFLVTKISKSESGIILPITQLVKFMDQQVVAIVNHANPKTPYKFMGPYKTNGKSRADWQTQ
tara:strand:+ start:149261 stop:149467 length:207 start_codon:yes stop_codon:yes gene_type:complete